MDHNKSALDEFSILCLWLCQIFPFCMGYLEETCWTVFDMLIYASTTQRKFMCSYELVSLFDCIPTFVYQLIVKSSRAFVFIDALFLWSVKPFYFRMSRRNKLQHLIHFQGWVKVVVFCRSRKPIQLIICSTLEYYRPLCQAMSWELNHLLWILDTVILLTIIIHFLVPVLLYPECRQMSYDVWIQYPCL